MPTKRIRPYLAVTVSPEVMAAIDTLLAQHAEEHSRSSLVELLLLRGLRYYNREKKETP